MKKSFLYVLLLLASTTVASAQGIAFEPGDWKSVVAKAKAENKLIFLDTYTTWCGPCKWMDKNVYPDAKVGEKFNAVFVNYKIDAEKGEGIDLAKKYQVTAYPTYLFVAPDESLVYRTIGSRPSEKFIEEADKAAAAGKGKSIGAFEAEYAAGKRDAAFLKEFLMKKKTLGYSDPNLLDAYLGTLSADSLRASSTLDLVADPQNPPLVGSKAFEVLATVPAAADVKPAYKQRAQMTLSQAVLRSARQGIREKNAALFEQALAANEKIQTRPGGADRLNTQLKMDFYKATKDLPKYTETTASYVNRYLLTANLDSLRQADARQFKQFMEPFTSGKMDSTSGDGKYQYNQIKKYGRSMNSDALAAQYNNAAWGFYENVTDKAQLEQALAWSKRSLDITRSSGYLDTYAHLLYKLGRQKEAVKIQEEAIALEKRKIAAGEEGDTKALEESLDKMKKKTMMSSATGSR